MASETAPVGKPSILRLRAGLLLLAALLMFCISSGRFVAVQFGLGWIWGTICALVVAALIGFGLTQLTRKIYFLLAAVITLVTTYFAFDFLRGALGWSGTTAFIFALVPFVVLAAAFWDFRRLKLEVTGWLNSP
ncbi:hypothetical protein ABLE91_19285 [Aquabacter sp. CN5-332]|uniref:hypothetical protein n=1 Tax=Aquabacter sp. CN5-332 TaxID=3156608 RepID=UPI0032B45A33